MQAEIDLKDQRIRALESLIHSLGGHYQSIIDGQRELSDSLERANLVYQRWAVEIASTPAPES